LAEKNSPLESHNSGYEACQKLNQQRNGDCQEYLFPAQFDQGVLSLQGKPPAEMIENPLTVPRARQSVSARASAFNIASIATDVARAARNRGAPENWPRHIAYSTRFTAISSAPPAQVANDPEAAAA
jgi:hypothetical protein